MIEVAEVVGIGLLSLKDSVGFHVLQESTDGIPEWKFCMDFPVITANFSALFPPFAALSQSPCP